MKILSHPPLLFIYHGTLRDTAALVGLRNMKAEIHKIVYAGEKTFSSRRYLVIVNRWLAAQGLPEVSAAPENVSRFLTIPAYSLLAAWGWKEAECSAAIRLAGLPLPCDSRPKLSA